MPAHHLSDFGGSLTRSLEHLLVGKSNRRLAMDRRIEVAFEILVPRGHRVVMHAAIEFDDESVAVLGVAVTHAHGGRRADLPCGTRQAMRPLHSIEVTVLQDRAGALGDVDENGSQPPTTTNPLA